MNKKGYSMVELIIMIALLGILIYGAIYVPTDIMSRHSQYTLKSIKINDIVLLRTAIANDLNNSSIEIISSDTLKIGDNKYEFGEKVTRETQGNLVILTNDKYLYKIENNILTVYNDEVNLKYNLSSSFKKVVSNNAE